MNLWVLLLDGIAVTVFGSVLSASFCKALASNRNRWIFFCYIGFLLLIQGLICFVWGDSFMRLCYPLITHLPLMALLWFLTGKVLWPVFSVFAAYLCCQLRRWLALLVATMLRGNPMLQNLVQLFITLPLLMLLLHFVSPSCRKLASRPVKLQVRFGIIPALYYVFDYFTVIYTDLLHSGNPVAVEFMPFVCGGAYLVFLLYHSDQEEKNYQMQQTQKILDLQISQSTREMEDLRGTQELIRRYRHDLRHHLQYVSACIENGRCERAQSYIADICREVEGQKVRQYCENEAANLILSAFAARAERDGIAMKIAGALPDGVKVSDSDLCVLLSNALENAIHACGPFLADGKNCIIDVQFYERGGKLFLQVTNPCTEEIRFENDIPVSEEPGHGIGVQSIGAIVQRYGGVHTFVVQDGQFILRLSV